jgi:hypothetical protein
MFEYFNYIINDDWHRTSFIYGIILGFFVHFELYQLFVCFGFYFLCSALCAIGNAIINNLKGK